MPTFIRTYTLACFPNEWSAISDGCPRVKQGSGNGPKRKWLVCGQGVRRNPDTGLLLPIDWERQPRQKVPSMRRENATWGKLRGKRDGLGSGIASTPATLPETMLPDADMKTPGSRAFFGRMQLIPFLQRVTREMQTHKMWLVLPWETTRGWAENNKNVARKPQTRQRIFQTRGRLASKEPQQSLEWTETTRNIPLLGDKSRNKNEDGGAKAPVT